VASGSSEKSICGRNRRLPICPSIRSLVVSGPAFVRSSGTHNLPPQPAVVCNRGDPQTVGSGRDFHRGHDRTRRDVGSVGIPRGGRAARASINA
jgi:hypothetical protein